MVVASAVHHVGEMLIDLSFWPILRYSLFTLRRPLLSASYFGGAP